MQTNFLFIIIFFSQILLLSFYLPGKIRRRVRYVFETYPQSKYPKLYPKPIEVYKLMLSIFWGINLVILGAGLLILVVLSVKSPDLGPSNPERWDQALVNAWFFVQFIPMFLMEISVFKYYKRMREANSSTTRKAALQPRRLFDFVSPVMIGLAILVYVAFIALIVYIRQFDYPWFGGYTNIVGVTAANLFFAGIVAWNMYGKKLNPHQAPEDRLKEIRMIAKQMVFLSIGCTLFIALSIVLSSWDLRHLQAAIMSVFFQLIAVIGFQTLRIDTINFEVYKDDSLATSKV